MRQWRRSDIRYKQSVKLATYMEEIGGELATNMAETAGSIRQISANIDSVKQQALTQASSVSETTAERGY